MTPGARVAAAIAILDEIQAGTVAEQALSAWARGSRFAGSKDRAAVRDHVFDVLRAKRSLGDGTGRQLMQRLALRENWDIDARFSGEGHAPNALSADEREELQSDLPLSEAARCDVPEWLWPQWQDSLGANAAEAALVQQGRAAVFLRVNRRNGSVSDATTALTQDGITVLCQPHVAGCLQVTENERRIKTSAAYLNGLVELQDAASQEAVRNTPVKEGGLILDYCAGGGGKALAFADLHDAAVVAHDIAPQRLRDLPARAARAGVQIAISSTADLGHQPRFDLVFCDAPCSGSGTWRRTPDAKWRLTQARLDALMQSQDEVLSAAAPLVAEGGTLVYATCSVLKSENSGAVTRFLAQNKEWRMHSDNQRLPNSTGDGFYTCVLMRK